MKKIEAIIRKSKFKAVKGALIEGGIKSFNYHLTRCISEESEKRFYRGVEFDAKSEDRVQLSLYVKDKDVESIIQMIRTSGATGNAADSYLAVFAAKKAYKLEGGENDDKLIEII